MSDNTAGRRIIRNNCRYVSTIPSLCSSNPSFSLFPIATRVVVTIKTNPQNSKKPTNRKHNTTLMAMATQKYKNVFALNLQWIYKYYRYILLSVTIDASDPK